MSIGEFARLTRLSPKALRLYGEMGLLLPARVDPDSAYRWYETAQLGQARLVALLRQIGVPLARIKVFLSLEPSRAAEEVAAYWADAESNLAARRELADILVDRLNGKGSVMYEVSTRARERPARRLEPGKEFIGILRASSIPLMEGRAGASGGLRAPGAGNGDHPSPRAGCRRDQQVQPSDLGVRVTYLVTPPRSANSVPDCDFAVPCRTETPFGKMGR